MTNVSFGRRVKWVPVLGAFDMRHGTKRLLLLAIANFVQAWYFHLSFFYRLIGGLKFSCPRSFASGNGWIFLGRRVLFCIVFPFVFFFFFFFSKRKK